MIDPATALVVVQLANQAVKAALDVGISWPAFRAAQDKAAAEGRLMNSDELLALVDKSQAAIDRI